MSALRRHSRSGSRLRLLDATAMGVGGMIGGGIFSVLGVAISLAGHLAFGCFVLGAMLAAVTARSYASIGARAAHAGGPFEHMRETGHEGFAGLLLWMLIVGYIVVMGVYAFTFGRYAANALGWSRSGARVLSVAIVMAFFLVNLGGIRTSALTEDLIVACKLLILGGIAFIGMSRMSVERLTPLASRGVGGLFLGAATIFVAYEGFELIAYDRGDIDRPETTMRRALYLSVAIVAVIYTSVALGAQMLVSDETIVAKKEVAFATVGAAALGPLGRWLAIMGALLATSSAINATVFSTARLVRDASAAGEVPRQLAREHAGVPIVALALLSAGGAATAMLPAITEVIAFGSASFLAVYAVVNLLDSRMAVGRRGRMIAAGGAAGCIAAIGCLLIELARQDVAALVLLLLLAMALAGGRTAFVASARRGAKGPSDPATGLRFDGSSKQLH